MKRKKNLRVICVCFIALFVMLWMGETQNIKGEEQEPEVRVLIKTSGYSSNFHSSITLKSAKGMSITNGVKTKKYAAGKKVTITQKYALLKNGGSITVKSVGSGKIKVSSIRRSQGIPAYRGNMVISNVPGSGLVLVNHVPVESYLYSVVGSEMSSSYHMEALKAQAVAARSYAYAGMDQKKYDSYGADIDDSTSYQVYNNCKENATVRSAVDATKNIVVRGLDSALTTYFFSTSFGQTALPSEVWSGDSMDAFYDSRVQVKDGQQKDLSSEEAFVSFYQDSTQDAFEKNVDWYRWKVPVSKKILQKQVNAKLGSCHAVYPSYVKVKKSDGTFVSQLISSVGTLKDINVVSRAKSGMVKELEITGSKATVRITAPSAVRMLLAPSYSKLEKQNGIQVSGLTMLPSAFFYIGTEGGNYTIYGGGNGHGVGMSQNGANQMALSGYSYQEILNHFFKQISLVDITQ